ncbi:hypothetical protein ACOMHN_039857 [Nucella lapillus]
MTAWTPQMDVGDTALEITVLMDIGEYARACACAMAGREDYPVEYAVDLSLDEDEDDDNGDDTDEDLLLEELRRRLHRHSVSGLGHTSFQQLNAKAAIAAAHHRAYIQVRHPAKGPPASSGWDAQLGTSMSPMEAERTARCVSLRLSRLKHGPTWDLRAYTPLHVRVWRGSASRDEVSSFVKGALYWRYVCDLLYSYLLHTGF